jgi:hypothetical protein
LPLSISSLILVFLNKNTKKIYQFLAPLKKGLTPKLGEARDCKSIMKEWQLRDCKSIMKEWQLRGCRSIEGKKSQAFWG